MPKRTTVKQHSRRLMPKLSINREDLPMPTKLDKLAFELDNEAFKLRKGCHDNVSSVDISDAEMMNKVAEQLYRRNLKEAIRLYNDQDTAARDRYPLSFRNVVNKPNKLANKLMRGDKLAFELDNEAFKLRKGCPDNVSSVDISDAEMMNKVAEQLYRRNLKEAIRLYNDQDTAARDRYPLSFRNVVN